MVRADAAGARRTYVGNSAGVQGQPSQPTSALPAGSTPGVVHGARDPRPEHPRMTAAQQPAAGGDTGGTRSAGAARLRGALMGPSGRLLRLVVAVGAVSGLAAAVFIAALQVLTSWIGPPRFGGLGALVVLVLTGVVISGMILVLGNPGDVELLVDNIHVTGGRSDIRDLRALLPVALVGIAAGSAIGPEAPLVQTTGSLGSWVALRLRLDQRDLRLLTIAGMAAGFTVLLGAPIGGSIFALEILHRRGLEYYEALIPAVLGSVTGYAVYAAVTGLGLQPYLVFPAPHPLGVADLLVGVAAGVVGAGIAWAFTYLVTTLRALQRRLPVWARPIVGGAALGVLGLVTPFALTFGEEQLNEVVAGGLPVAALLLAAVAKLVGSATITTAGWRGGFIIPLFFVGACVGLAAAEVLGIDPVVAMTTLMAAAVVGVTKTPLGSALVVSEIAGLRVLPPVLVASLVALLLTSRVSLLETQRRREGEFADGVPQAEGGAAEALLHLGEHDPALGGSVPEQPRRADTAPRRGGTDA